MDIFAFLPSVEDHENPKKKDVLFSTDMCQYDLLSCQNLSIMHAPCDSLLGSIVLLCLFNIEIILGNKFLMGVCLLPFDLFTIFPENLLYLFLNTIVDLILAVNFQIRKRNLSMTKA